MAACLIALGSNLGDRTATLDAAIAALSATAGVQVVRCSAWQLTLPVGGRRAQPEFFNGAALIETSRGAADFHALLQQIEVQLGRQRHERWGDRTLDLDLLLYGDAVIDSPALTVPHPRMSFRHFVLEPAVQIAAPMVHPEIGWTLERLLEHLDGGADCVALVAPSATARRELAAALRERFGLTEGAPSIADERLWPTSSTAWLTVPDGQMSSEHPKLTILLDSPTASEAGRGPTLQIPPTKGDNADREIFAAIAAVWPRLGSRGDQRLQ